MRFSGALTWAAAATAMKVENSGIMCRVYAVTKEAAEVEAKVQGLR